MSRTIKITRGDKTYKLARVTTPHFCDCTRKCAFRKRDDKSGEFVNEDAGYCTRGCYLPKWFVDLQIPDSWLEKVK